VAREPFLDGVYLLLKISLMLEVNLQFHSGDGKFTWAFSPGGAQSKMERLSVNLRAVAFANYLPAGKRLKFLIHSQ
jgi:hypothetical protein